MSVAPATMSTANAPYTTSDGTQLDLGASIEVGIDDNGVYEPGTATITITNHNGDVVATKGAGDIYRFTSAAGHNLKVTLLNRNSMTSINLRNHIVQRMSAVSAGANSPNFVLGANNSASATAALGGTPIATQQQTNAALPAAAPTISGDGPPVNISIPGADRIRKVYPTLVYPMDLSKQDTIKFSMKSNEGSTITAGIGIENIVRRTGNPIQGSVTLPIPGGIQDSNSVNFNEGTINPMEAYLVKASMNLMESGKDLAANIGRVFSEAAKEFKSNTNYGGALKLYLAQEATSTQGLLSRATGAILNPNLELLFNKPTLRDFSFIFRMSPRHEDEADEVKQIIRFFKQGMSVKHTADGTFLKSPHVFDIKYQAYTNEEGPQHKSIGKIKTCALMNCTTNYTPDGSYMTFVDNKRTMTSYELTLQFKELTPINEEDYLNDADPTEIGF